MGIKTFFLLEGPLIQKALKILCLICWAAGGCVYAYGTYETFNWSLSFRGKSNLTFAVWLIHFSLRFLALWVPMGFLLIQWQMKRIVVPVVYIAGCCFGLLLGIVALILVLPYTDDGQLRNEYTDTAKNEMGPDKKFPTSTLSLIKSDKCCSWFGPTDFMPNGLFDITDKINEDVEFMKSVADCYGNTFEVSGTKGQVKYAPAKTEPKKEDIPIGCGLILVDRANRISNFILFVVIIAVLLTLVVIVLYILCYRKIPSMGVGAGPSAPDTTVGEDNDQNNGLSDPPSMAASQSQHSAS